MSITDYVIDILLILVIFRGAPGHIPAGWNLAGGRTTVRSDE